MAHFISRPDFTFEHAAIPHPLQFQQDLAETIAAHQEADGTFARLWPTAVVLCNHLCEHPELVAGKHIVELGAGSGAVGLVCAALGAASVTLTDVPEALPLLTANLERNPTLAANTTVAPCTWGNAEHIASLLDASAKRRAHADDANAAQQQQQQLQRGGFDIVLCCEVIYQQGEDVLLALAQTQGELALRGGGGGAGGSSRVLLAYEFRNAMTDDITYFDAATDAFGECESIALTGREAEALMGGKADDGIEDRFLFVYEVPPL